MTQPILPDEAKDRLIDIAKEKAIKYEEAYLEWFNIKDQECQCGPNTCFNCRRVSELKSFMYNLLLEK